MLVAIISIAEGLAAIRQVTPELTPGVARNIAKELLGLVTDMVALKNDLSPSKRPEQDLLAEISKQMLELRKLVPDLKRHAGRKVFTGLEVVMAEAEATRAALDPIKMSAATFDPGDPDTAGRLVSLALISQPHAPLATVARTYGSGVYAIYYRGPHRAYAGISGTETPIYVGKADPASSAAKTAREQGPRLFGRLADHRKMIRLVERYAIDNAVGEAIHLAHFTCRKLVCATNAQLVAERHLIDIFKPIWNQETKICWGISKHGDTAEMRGNTRSPWDVIHPGRLLFMSEKLASGTTPEEIERSIASHLIANPPYHDRAAIIERVIAAFAQEVVTTSAETQELEDALMKDDGTEVGDEEGDAPDDEATVSKPD